MSIILPDNHPALETLKQEGIAAIPASKAADAPRVRVALTNTMSNPVETETQFARALSNAEQNVELVSFSPKARLSKSFEILRKYQDVDPATLDEKTRKDIEKAKHRVKFHQPLSRITVDPSFAGIIMAGFGGSKFDLSQSTPQNKNGIDFYDELMNVVDHARTRKIPTLATCWSAHADLNRQYGVGRKVNETKLTGVFDVAVIRPEDPLVDGMAPQFPLPVSRYGECDEQKIITNPDLIVLATSDKTGAAIIREADGPVIYMTGHLEYLAETLEEEFERDTAKMGDAAPKPENYDVKSPVRTWENANARFYSNLVNEFERAQATQPRKHVAIAKQEHTVRQMMAEPAPHMQHGG